MPLTKEERQLYDQRPNRKLRRKLHMRELRQDEEYRQKERKHRELPEIKQRVKELAQIRNQRPEVKQKNRELMRRKRESLTQEEKERIREQQRNHKKEIYWKDPEYIRRKKREYDKRPKRNLKKRESLRKFWNQNKDEINKQRRERYAQDEVYKQKLREQQTSIRYKLRAHERFEERYKNSKVREKMFAHAHRRRKLGYIPLNEPFEGADAHHIDFECIVYIPHKLHRSIRHCVWTDEKMPEINDKAFEWLIEQRQVMEGEQYE